QSANVFFSSTRSAKEADHGDTEAEVGCTEKHQASAIGAERSGARGTHPEEVPGSEHKAAKPNAHPDVCVSKRTQGAAQRRASRPQRDRPFRPGRGRQRYRAAGSLEAYQSGGEEIRCRSSRTRLARVDARRKDPLVTWWRVSRGSPAPHSGSTAEAQPRGPLRPVMA